MSDLPCDLIEEILCRVPATSLRHLRSTCKQWNLLFNNRRFTRKHFDKSPKQLMTLMLNESMVCSTRVNLNGVPEVTSELSLVDPLYSSLIDHEFDIDEVFHCDGLLLCINEDNTRLVVWNPCTSQARWIQPKTRVSSHALGSYHGNSYKVLSYHPDFAIFENNTNSWRSLDITPDCTIADSEQFMSLKGKTYWFAYDKKDERPISIFLLSFDYTSETFERLRLPCQSFLYETMSMSVVREEKLSVLLQRDYTSRTEIWVTNKIGETKEVSWSMFLALDYSPAGLHLRDTVSFLVEEEKKVIVCCDRYLEDEFHGKKLIHIVGEQNQVREFDFGEAKRCPILFNYVPSLTQIHQGVVDVTTDIPIVDIDLILQQQNDETVTGSLPTTSVSVPHVNSQPELNMNIQDVPRLHSDLIADSQEPYVSTHAPMECQDIQVSTITTSSSTPQILNLLRFQHLLWRLLHPTLSTRRSKIVDPLHTLAQASGFESPSRFTALGDVEEAPDEPMSSLGLTRGLREIRPPKKFQDLEWKTARGRGKRGCRGRGNTR
ncbi:unnamed protein product [Brassica oleracea var. botrytis]